MPKLDKSLKIVWLVIGLATLFWLGTDGVPAEYRQWERRLMGSRRTLHPHQEPGILVGERAEQDRMAGIRRQGLRFGRILDPTSSVSRRPGGSSVPADPLDWLLIPVTLATFSRPVEAEAIMVNPPDDEYRWHPGNSYGGYMRMPLSAVNVVFYRRNGSEDRLLLDRPAWVEAVYLPAHRGEAYYYEIAVLDRNGDGRITGYDGMTLWTANPDGTGLHIIWLPPGEIRTDPYHEPLSGDLFGTMCQDTDGDGKITEYDQPELFRMALGDTASRSVVSAQTMARLKEISFPQASGPDF